MSLPTHQISFPKPRSPNTKTAKAVGLKICFLPSAIKYFEAIAIIPAAKLMNKPVWDEIGIKMKNNIKAVIKEDSLFVSALKSFARSLLVK